jgi:hypothetical protein
MQLFIDYQRAHAHSSKDHDHMLIFQKLALNWKVKRGKAVSFSAEPQTQAQQGTQTREGRLYVFKATKTSTLAGDGFEILMWMSETNIGDAENVPTFRFTVSMDAERKRTHSDPAVELYGPVVQSNFTSRRTMRMFIKEGTNTTRGKSLPCEINITLEMVDPVSEEIFMKRKNPKTHYSLPPALSDVARSLLDVTDVSVTKGGRLLVPGKYTDPKYTHEPGYGVPDAETLKQRRARLERDGYPE